VTTAFWMPTSEEERLLPCATAQLKRDDLLRELAELLLQKGVSKVR
jgi:hypothetical protein